MSYPAQMQESIKKVEASRRQRLENPYPEMDLETKAELLRQFHPDFNLEVKHKIGVGVSQGDLAPKELADCLEARSRLPLDAVDLKKIDHETEVLVIGSGGGGLSAALTAQAAGAKVLLATKLRMGDSNTIMAEGGIGAASRPEDSPAIHYVDTLVGGRGLNVPELVETLVTEAPFILEWLAKMGVNFDREPDGAFFAHRPGGHSRRRSHSVMDITGLEIMRVMTDEVRNRGILVLEFSPAVELLLDDKGNCAGAVLYNFDTDTYTVVKAKAVILATGGMGRLHPLGFPTSNHYGATADGWFMGYRAGPSFYTWSRCNTIPRARPGRSRCWGFSYPRRLGPRAPRWLTWKANPLPPIWRPATPCPRPSSASAACGGKGVMTPTGMVGVWLDTPQIDMVHGEGTCQRRFAGILSRFRKHGIEPVTEPILVYPTQHYQNGGLKIDVHGQTTVPNLYAVGEVSGGVHGHNRLGCNSLLDIFVFGRRAGRHVAPRLKEITPGELSLKHVANYHKALDEAGLGSEKVSPILLPDYRFEKALTSVQHVEQG